MEIAGATVVSWVGSAVAVAAWLRRRNRVSPNARSRAPLTWLVSPSRAALAHRRLRRAVVAVRAATAPRDRRTNRDGGELAACVAELQRHAAAVDDHLVLAARCSPAVRRNLVRGLGREVGDVERLAARVTTAALGQSLGSAARRDDAVRHIAERLDALEAAHADLAALEATWASPAFNPARPRLPSHQPPNGHPPN